MSSSVPSCSETKETVMKADLPLFCPRNDGDLWASHPRVFIPIEEAENHEALCPYCGTHFVLK